MPSDHGGALHERPTRLFLPHVSTRRELSILGFTCFQGSEKQGEHVHQQTRTILQPAGETAGQEGKEGLFNEDPGDPAIAVILR